MRWKEWKAFRKMYWKKGRELSIHMSISIVDVAAGSSVVRMQKVMAEQSERQERQDREQKERKERKEREEEAGPFAFPAKASSFCMSGTRAAA